MQTRMERYYGSKNRTENNNSPNRSDVNQNLYEEVIDLNNDGDSLDGAIDISRIKDLVEARENENKTTDYKSLLKLEEDLAPAPTYKEPEPLDKTFDINKVIMKAKEEIDTNPIDGLNENPRKLNNTNYDILNNINTNEASQKEPVEEIKELFNTITMEALNADKSANDLALAVLNTLKPEETDTNLTGPITTDAQVADDLPTKEMIMDEPTKEATPEPVNQSTLTTATAFTFTMENAKPLNEIAENRKELLDNNLEKTINEFYTGNIEFDPKDFEDLDDGTKLNKVVLFLIILLIAVVGATGYYIYLNFL